MKDFRATGRMGCARCYTTFEPSMRELLRRVHGSPRHIGRAYRPPKDEVLEKASVLGELRERLRRAIDAGAVRGRGRAARPDPGAGMTLDLSLLPDGGVGGSTRRARTPTSCCPRACAWRGTWRATRSPDGRATASGCACWSRCARRCRWCQGSDRAACWCGIDELGPGERALLLERHLVSKELAGLEPQHPLRTGAAVYLSDGLSVMVNEEDHLRLAGAAIRVRAARGVRCARPSRPRARWAGPVLVPPRVRVSSRRAPRTWEPGCVLRYLFICRGSC